MIIKKALLFTLFLTVSVCWNGQLFAQTELERISIAERADELGYVLRYHLSEPADSVALSRPTQNRVQMILYSEDISTEDYLYLGLNELVGRIQFTELPEGLGVEISLRGNRHYLTSAYPDQNGRDMLLAFTRTTPGELEQHLAAVNNRDLLSRQEPRITETAPDEAHEVEADPEEPAEPGEIAEETDPDHTPDEESVSEETGFVRPEFLEKDHSTASLQSIMPGDPMELYVRTQIPFDHANGTPSHFLRPAAMNGYGEILQGRRDHPWASHSFFRSLADDDESSAVRIFSPQFYFSHNNNRPDGFNDGALWQGRGNNTAVSAGVSLQYGPFRGVFRPVMIYSENREFELSPHPPNRSLSDYAMALTSIDSPQRFGEESLNRFDLGDSYIEAEYSGWSAGFSNRRMWTGPAVYNPLLFSNNAPGFLHGYIGTSRPFSIPSGHIESRLFWGGLQESDYFDERPWNNLRFVTGFVLTYSPDLVPGLHVGMARVAYTYYRDGITASDLVLAFRSSPSRSEMESAERVEVRTAKSTFFIRWAYPRIGFEVYAEWGRNDDKRPIRDIISEPELNRAYVLGVLQRVNVGDYGSLLLNGEITNLENSSVTTQFRENNTWYAHPRIRQGFTHRGQVLGSAIGPGSSTQVANASFYHKWGMVGYSIARIAMHNDRLFNNREYYQSTLPRDWMNIWRIPEVEIRQGIHGLVFLPWNFELQADLYSGLIENRHNEFDRPTPGGIADDIYFDERNVRFSLTLRYNLPGGLR